MNLDKNQKESIRIAFRKMHNTTLKLVIKCMENLCAPVKKFKTECKEALKKCEGNGVRYLSVENGEKLKTQRNALEEELGKSKYSVFENKDYRNSTGYSYLKSALILIPKNSVTNNSICEKPYACIETQIYKAIGSLDVFLSSYEYLNSIAKSKKERFIKLFK